MLRIGTIFLIILLSRLAFADGGDTTRIKRVKIFPLPAIGYSPETRWYVGAVGLFNIRFDNDTASKPSTFEAEFNYTQNKQVIVTADFEMRFRGSDYLLIGENGFFRFPESYWGRGIQTTDEDEIKIDADRIEIDNTLLRRIKGHFYGGARVKYHKADVKSADDSTFFFTVPDKNKAFGGGVVLLYDSRDNPINATNGMRIYLSGMSFVEGYKKLDFQRLDADIRWYQKIFRHHVFAIQAISGNTGGDVPFRMLPLMGNENIMRGYYEGRYRDQHLAAMQGELRLRVWNWIGATAFAGTGTVFNKSTKMNTMSFLPNYGLGLRIRLDKKDNVNLRFDYGMGKDADGFYVSFGEAF